MPDAPIRYSPEEYAPYVTAYEISSMRPTDNSRVEELERVINAVLSTVRAAPLSAGEEPLAFKELLDVEVEPDHFPATSILFSAPAETDSETGNVTENTWTFIQRSYFDFTDQERSQREHKRFTPAIFAAFRLNNEIELEDGTYVTFAVADGGLPIPTPDNGMFVKALRITATTEEEEPEID